MLTAIGAAMQGKVPDVTTPRVVDERSTKRVLTMTFVEGESLADIIQRAIRAAGMSSAADFSEKAAKGMKTADGAPVDGGALVGKLVETFSGCRYSPWVNSTAIRTGKPPRRARRRDALRH